MRRVSAAFIVFSLVALGCGDDGSPSTAAGPPDPAAVTAAAVTLTDRWDDRLAFFAVVASFDHGYTVVQIVEGAAQLQADGQITGVEPAGAALGMLSPLTGGANLPGLTAAPRRLPAVQFAGPIPVDQQVDFADEVLGEFYEAGQRRIEAEEVFGADGDELLVAGVTEATLQLAASGYSAEQILDALITGLWLPPGAAGSCAFIPTSNDIETFQVVLPQNPDFLCHDLRGLVAGGFPRDDDTTTSSRATPPGGQTGSTDGTYAGPVLLIDSPQQITEILEGTAEITVTEGVAEVAVVVMFEQFGVDDPNDDEPACLLIDQMVLSGTGTVVDGLLEVELVIDEYTHVDQVGCTRGPSVLAGITVPLAGEIDGDSLIAFFYGDLMIEASRV